MKKYADYSWYGFDTWTKDRVKSDLASYNDPESTGDFSPTINQGKWNWEQKKIAESKKDSIVSCFNPPELNKDAICSIRTLGLNRFLVTLTHDNYKDVTSRVEYRTYIKNRRIVFYGDSFYTEDVLPTDADIKKLPVYQLFLSGKTSFSSEAKIMEEIANSLEKLGK